MTLTLILNGEDVTIGCDEGKRLSDVLRDGFGLLSVRSGCSLGSCGSCTVLIDGRAVPSCMVLAFAAQDAEIVTYEGFRETAEHRDVEEGFKAAGYECCGYCAPGRMIAVSALLERNREPDPRAIREALAGINCRCSGSSGVEEAVRAAAAARQGRLERNG